MSRPQGVSLPPAVVRYSTATGLYFVGVRMGRKIAPLYSFDSRELARTFAQTFNSSFRREGGVTSIVQPTTKGHG